MMRFTLLAMAMAAAAPALAGEDKPQDDILLALELPRQADALRRAGVPDADVRSVLQKSRDKHLTAAESEDVMHQGHEAVMAHGAIDNFGAFVGARLDEGLRGKDLAQAIRAEHEARGKNVPGKPDAPAKAAGATRSGATEGHGPTHRPGASPSTGQSRPANTRPGSGGTRPTTTTPPSSGSGGHRPEGKGK